MSGMSSQSISDQTGIGIDESGSDWCCGVGADGFIFRSSLVDVHQKDMNPSLNDASKKLDF